VLETQDLEAGIQPGELEGKEFPTCPRLGRVLQRNGGQSGEPLRMLFDDVGEEVVGCAGVSYRDVRVRLQLDTGTGQ
jgi:hypothetical protein